VLEASHVQGYAVISTFVVVCARRGALEQEDETKEARQLTPGRPCSIPTHFSKRLYLE
jgi:hypothetical protein